MTLALVVVLGVSALAPASGLSALGIGACASAATGHAGLVVDFGTVTDVADAARAAGRLVIVTAAEGAVGLFDAVRAGQVTERTVWVVGSEARGVSESARDRADLAVVQRRAGSVVLDVERPGDDRHPRIGFAPFAAIAAGPTRARIALRPFCRDRLPAALAVVGPARMSRVAR